MPQTGRRARPRQRLQPSGLCFASGSPCRLAVEWPQRHPQDQSGIPFARFSSINTETDSSGVPNEIATQSVIGCSYRLNELDRPLRRQCFLSHQPLCIFCVIGCLILQTFIFRFIGSVLDRIQDGYKALIVDFSAVPFLDSTGTNMIEGLARKAHERGIALWLTGANRDIVRLFLEHGLKKPLVKYVSTVEGAISSFRNGDTAKREAA